MSMLTSTAMTGTTGVTGGCGAPESASATSANSSAPHAAESALTRRFTPVPALYQGTACRCERSTPCRSNDLPTPPRAPPSLLVSNVAESEGEVNASPKNLPVARELANDRAAGGDLSGERSG